MNRPRISDVIGIINKKYPIGLAEDWDNTGFQMGDPSTVVEKIMVALDPLPEVVDQAIASQCQLLITHHPLIFSPLRQITPATTTGRLVLKAAASGLAVLSMHTNYDIAVGGLNDLLAERIGLQDIKPLKVTGHEELVKLVVFVPADYLDVVRDPLFDFAETLGNYRNCSFSASGEGTFLPLEGAQPAIGAIGKQEKATEFRLELLVRKERLSRAVRTLLSVHPYEEPAFDCYPLLNESFSHGLGRVGRLCQAVPLRVLTDSVVRTLGCSAVRIVGDSSRLVQKIAICSGGGASLLRDAIRAGADVLLTGDVKYHEAREAEMQGIALLDAGHFSTERIMVEAVRSFLEEALCRNGFSAELHASANETDPFTTVTAPQYESNNAKEKE